MIVNPKLEFNGDKMKARDFDKLRLIILHHRAGHGDVYSIHQLHKKRGWAGIGYHYYITTDGEIYKGRPVQFVGSHCRGNNESSIGICLEGDFRNEKPSEAQLESLTYLVMLLAKDYGQIKRVLNHNDLYKTSCPVVNLKAMLEGVDADGYIR